VGVPGRLVGAQYRRIPSGPSRSRLDRKVGDDETGDGRAARRRRPDRARVCAVGRTSVRAAYAAFTVQGTERTDLWCSYGFDRPPSTRSGFASPCQAGPRPDEDPITSSPCRAVPDSSSPPVVNSTGSLPGEVTEPASGLSLPEGTTTVIPRRHNDSSVCVS
jgi:hypothetical protein